MEIQMAGAAASTLTTTVDIRFSDPNTEASGEVTADTFTGASNYVSYGITLDAVRTTDTENEVYFTFSDGRSADEKNGSISDDDKEIIQNAACVVVLVATLDDDAGATNDREDLELPRGQSALISGDMGIVLDDSYPVVVIDDGTLEIDNILIDGESLEGFDMDSYYYNVEIASYDNIPTLTVDAPDDMTVTITLPDASNNYTLHDLEDYTGEVTMRIDHQNGTYTMYYSIDDVNFTSIGSLTNTLYYPRIGFFTYNANLHRTRYLSVESLSVTPIKTLSSTQTVLTDTVAVGTTTADFLPEIVYVDCTSGVSEPLTVVWDDGNYNANVTGTYAFTGSVAQATACLLQVKPQMSPWKSLSLMQMSLQTKVN